MKSQLKTIIVLTGIMLLIACPKPDPVIDTTIYLEVIDTSSTSITLKVSVEDPSETWNFFLYRNNSFLLEGTVSSNDTTIIDSSLVPDTEYTYRSYLMDDSETLDSTETWIVTTNPKEYLIVPQVNIPWPSLGDTPWPMHHHDPQSTGRSQYAGPSGGYIDQKILTGITESSLAIGYNSTFFIGASYPSSNSSGFYSYDYSGNMNWTTLFRTFSTPIIGVDSSIYAGGYGVFTSFTHDGDTVWTKSIEQMQTLGVNIDKNGNLYFIDQEATLTVLSSDGELLWTLQDERFFYWSDAVPTFSPDGNTLYVQGMDVSVLAVDINTHSIKWTFGNERLLSAPVVDNAGNLYFVPGEQETWRLSDSLRTLYSVNFDGNINWKYDFNSTLVWDNTEVTIDYDGNIYFATDTLYSFANNGELRWKLDFEPYVYNTTALVCDVNNTIYVGAQGQYSSNHPSSEIQIMAVSHTGELLWIIRDNDERALAPSSAIAEDGTMFYPTWDNSPGTFLIIK